MLTSHLHFQVLYGQEGPGNIGRGIVHKVSSLFMVQWEAQSNIHSPYWALGGHTKCFLVLVLLWEEGDKQKSFAHLMWGSLYLEEFFWLKEGISVVKAGGPKKAFIRVVRDTHT